jgi:hypothetical protein
MSLLPTWLAHEGAWSKILGVVTLTPQNRLLIHSVSINTTEVLKVQCSAKLAAQLLLRHLAHPWHMKTLTAFQFGLPILRCPNKNG